MPVTARALADRYSAQFDTAGLCFGHGTDNAADEALFLVLHALGWDYDVSAAQLDESLPEDQARRAEALLRRRLEERVPAAYLAGRMWFAGHEFIVDERVLVPRSPLAELIVQGMAPWVPRSGPRRILDIGTGSGCIAISCALRYSAAIVDALDISAAALSVAAANCERHGVSDRVRLIEADVFPAQGHYDLIISNPPYVPERNVEALPAEYRAEPALALAAGVDGMDIVARIMREAHTYLADDGVLIMEVGEIASAVDARYHDLPLTWLDLAHGGDGVFVITRDDLVSGNRT